MAQKVKNGLTILLLLLCCIYVAKAIFSPSGNGTQIAKAEEDSDTNARARKPIPGFGFSCVSRSSGGASSGDFCYTYDNATGDISRNGPYF
jgi:hypothetical protein